MIIARSEGKLAHVRACGEGRARPTENGMHNLKSCQGLRPFCPFSHGGIDGFRTSGGECLRGADEDDGP